MKGNNTHTRPSNRVAALAPGSALLEAADSLLALNEDQLRDLVIKLGVRLEKHRRALSDIAAEALQHGEHNPISGQTLLPQGYQKIHRMAIAALPNAVVIGDPTLKPSIQPDRDAQGRSM